MLNEKITPSKKFTYEVAPKASFSANIGLEIVSEFEFNFEKPALESLGYITLGYFGALRIGALCCPLANWYSRVHADGESADEGGTQWGWTTAAQGHEIVDGKTGDSEEGGRILAALATAAHRITEDIVRTHTELFECWDPAHVHIREALRAERAVIKSLRKASPRGGVWTTRHSVALPLLARRMDKLEQTHEAMCKPLERLQGQFPSEEPMIIGSEAAWLGDVGELLRGWATAYMDVQEGVLHMLRRGDVKNKPRRRYPSSSWGEWKRRNYGGTSCFDERGGAESVKQAFRTGNPIAEVAGDETRWLRSLGGDEAPRVWVDVYEKACCEDSMLAHWLRNGASQPRKGRRWVVSRPQLEILSGKVYNSSQNRDICITFQSLRVLTLCDPGASWADLQHFATYQSLSKASHPTHQRRK
ncbi:hypothetical protein F5X98DRAFT_391389 [Xylaria grammica]|nr:hypothetical protein F5X98DRAFT_391389 [Xylaria grammica]